MIALVFGVWLNSATVVTMEDYPAGWGYQSGCAVYAAKTEVFSRGFVRIEGHTCQEVADILNGVKK